MYGFSNQVKVLHNVTPIDLLAQSAVLLVQTQRVWEGMLALPYPCWVLVPSQPMRATKSWLP